MSGGVVMHKIYVTDEVCPRCSCGYSPSGDSMESLWRDAIRHVDSHPTPTTSWPGGRPPTEEEKAELLAMIDATEMCNHCCRRVPKAEVQAGLHEHPMVMD